MENDIKKVSSDALLEQIFSITQNLYKEMSRTDDDAENDHNTIYRLLTDLGRTLVNADRASFWKWDKRSHSLWTTAAVGEGRITIPEGTGLVGKALAENLLNALKTAYPEKRFVVTLEINPKTATFIRFHQLWNGEEPFVSQTEERKNTEVLSFQA